MSFPSDEEVLDWAKRVFPEAVKIEECQYLCRFPVTFRVLTASGNCIAIAAVSDDDMLPWFMPTGSTEL